MEFNVNDETVKTSHGFRVLNAGIDYARFNVNPVMLYQHNHDKLIGRWKNWKVKGSELVMEPEFDEVDEFALSVKGKVDREFLRGASMGIIIKKLEYDSEDENDMVVTSCELCEVSLVSVPSNKGAIKLYNDQMQELSLNDVTTLFARVNNSNINQLNNKENMEKVTLTVAALTALGLQNDATDVAISAAIVELQQRCNSAVTELQQHKEGVATGMVDKAVAEGRITADKREAFLSLAKTNYDLAKQTLETLPVKTSLSAKVTNSTPAANGDSRDAWTYKDWAKKDPAGLAKLKLSDNAAFVALQAKI